KIIKRKCLSIVNRRKVVGTSTSFRMSNLPLGVFLIALGAPIGRKSENLTKIPSWIINGSKKIKKEFLSAYFGSELQIIRPRKYGKGFDMIRLYIYKDKKLEENAVEFANTLIR
ncbi:MAG: hypothetical protein QXT63_03880, partial [Thermoplasmata archaeon]